VAAGCGGDDSSNDSASPPDAPSQAENVPTDADALKDRCVEELTQTGQSEAEAEKTCTIPDDAEIDAAVEAAVEGCLEAAKGLPEGSERDQAEQDCRESAE
jgi:hypothetical protein